MIEIKREKQISSLEFNAIFEQLNIKNDIVRAKTIVIKPNFASGHCVEANSHTISDISFLSDIINSILELNSETLIYVAESDSAGYGFAYLKFEHLNLPSSLFLDDDKNKKVITLDLSRDKLVRVYNENFKYFCTEETQLWVSEKLMKADFIISLSNLKTHVLTGYSGACKNLFGCLPAFEKFSYHTDIHKVIHDITIAVNPQMCIIDAFYAIEGNGPLYGTAINCGYRIFSNSSIEIDICASQTIGLNPKKVKHLRYLIKSGLAESYINDTYSEIRKFKKPALFLRVFTSIGLVFQKTGVGISRYGHMLSVSKNPLGLIKATIRFFILIFISENLFKKIKKKVLGKPLE